MAVFSKKRLNLNRPTFKELDVGDLSIANYQRGFRISKSKGYAKTFDYDLLGIILVSYRDGEYWIVDGQHRVEALKMLGINKVMCQILTGLTYEQEADKFDKLNTNRTPLNSVQKFHARVEKKEQKALEIVDILNKYGMTYAKDIGIRSENCIACVARLSKIQANDGNYGLERVIRTIKRAWFGEQSSLSAGLVQGIGTFLHENTNIDENYLVSALEKQEPSKIVELASQYADNKLLRSMGIRSNSPCYHVAKIVRDLYNNEVPKNKRIA